MQNFLHRQTRAASRSSCKAFSRELICGSVAASSLTLTLKGLSRVKITSPKLDTAHLTANEEALLRCQAAMEQKDRGDYEGAQEVMRPLWKDFGERPNFGGLHPSVTAEVLLSVGILTCWIGNKLQLSETQEVAKNLITESLTYYESAGDMKKVAAARSELAYCYWWKGEFNEARIMFTAALQKLTAEGNTRARALLGLAVVEWSASRYNEAFRILTEHASLFKKINSHAIKASYHNQLAIVLRNLSASENRQEYLQRAIGEYEAADFHSKLAHNIDFRADLKNNVGFLLYKLSRFKDAHRYLEEAKRLAATIRNKVLTAQIDDTRAQALIAERKFKQAEAIARDAVHVLENSGHQCLLADALITHGIALARLGPRERAQSVFERAIEVAHQVGALNKAGLAALTLIEELDEAGMETLCIAFDRASEWLADSQSEDLLRRLNAAARRVLARLHGERGAEEATEALVNRPGDLQSQVLKYERMLIRQALARANGRLTRAASLLGVSYQGLGYIIQSRHRDLLKERSPVRPRARR
jgi:tetratricopeptide (TPR) repeat protein